MFGSAFPGAARRAFKVFVVYKMLMALIVHHREYFEEHLHPDSILRYLPFWTDDIPFPEKVVVKYPWDATSETPKITIFDTITSGWHELVVGGVLLSYNTYSIHCRTRFRAHIYYCVRGCPTS